MVKKTEAGGVFTVAISAGKEPELTKAKPNKAPTFLNRNGSAYHLDFSAIGSLLEGEHIFTDEVNNISAKCHFEAGHLEIEVLPETTDLKLIGNLKCDRLSLVMNSTIQLAFGEQHPSSLNINSRDLIFQRSLMNCEKIKLQAQNFLSLHSDIMAKTISVSARKITSQAHLTADTLNFHATETLSLKSEITAQNDLIFEAPSILQSADLNCQKLSIKADKKLVNRGHIFAGENAHISGASFVNRGHCYSSQSFMINTKEYIAEKGSSLFVQNMLQIMVGSWENLGECVSYQYAFIKADHLDNKAKIEFGHKFYVSCISFTAQPGSELNTSSVEEAADCQYRMIEIGRKFQLASGSSLKLIKTRLTARSSRIAGSILAEHSLFLTKDLVVEKGGELQIEKSGVECSETFILRENAMVQSIASILRSNNQAISGRLIAVDNSLVETRLVTELRLDGFLELNQSHLSTNKINSFGIIHADHQSVLAVNNTSLFQDGSSLHVGGNSQFISAKALICVGSNASINVKESRIKAEIMELDGSLIFDKTQLKSSRLIFKAQFEANKSIFLLENLLSLKNFTGKSKLVACSVKAEAVDVGGKLIIDHSKIQTNIVRLNSLSAVHLIKSAHLDANVLIASEESELSITRESRLDANVVSADSKVHCENAFLKVENFESSKGTIYFKDTEVQSPGFISILAESRFDKAHVDASSVRLSGYYEMASSTLVCDHLVQVDSGLVAASDVKVARQHSISKESSVLLSSGTSFSSAISELEGDLNISNSEFRAQNLLHEAATISLERAKFEIEGLMRSFSGSNFFAKSSDLKLGIASFSGVIKVDDSFVSADALHVHADAEIIGSKIMTKRHLGFWSGQNNIKYSELDAASITAGTKLSAKGSELKTEKLVALEEAGFVYSKIDAHDVSISGPVKFDHCTLTTDEMMVYSHFVQKASKILARNKFELMATAAFDSEESTLHAKKVRLGGAGYLKDTRV
ncbi:MAG TPA: hypothetical protein VD770_00475, partial [Coxiellaceae bacterium]|nr:hypothetical protein [Coxiellaceae bacterium]